MIVRDATLGPMATEQQEPQVNGTASTPRYYPRGRDRMAARARRLGIATPMLPDGSQSDAEQSDTPPKPMTPDPSFPGADDPHTASQAQSDQDASPHRTLSGAERARLTRARARHSTPCICPTCGDSHRDYRELPEALTPGTRSHLPRSQG